MTKFIFDLDGTITKQETLPLIAKHFQIEKEIHKITTETVAGNIPFMESFIRRVYLMKDLSVKEIDELLSHVLLYDDVVNFIQLHAEKCCIATGNLQCWIHELSRRIGGACYSSQGVVKDDKVVKLTKILKKENVVQRYMAEGNRVVFIGDGNNDVEAMRMADVSIASGLTHPPAQSVTAIADYQVLNEVSLCRLLNQLL